MFGYGWSGFRVVGLDDDWLAKSCRQHYLQSKCADQFCSLLALETSCFSCNL